MAILDLFKKMMITFLGIFGRTLGFIPVMIYGYIYS